MPVPFITPAPSNWFVGPSTPAATPWHSVSPPLAVTHARPTPARHTGTRDFLRSQQQLRSLVNGNRDEQQALQDAILRSAALGHQGSGAARSGTAVGAHTGLAANEAWQTAAALILSVKGLSDTNPALLEAVENAVGLIQDLSTPPYSEAQALQVIRQIFIQAGNFPTSENERKEFMDRALQGVPQHAGEQGPDVLGEMHDTDQEELELGIAMSLSEQDYRDGSDAQSTRSRQTENHRHPRPEQLHIARNIIPHVFMYQMGYNRASDEDRRAIEDGLARWEEAAEHLSFVSVSDGEEADELHIAGPRAMLRNRPAARVTFDPSRLILDRDPHRAGGDCLFHALEGKTLTKSEILRTRRDVSRVPHERLDPSEADNSHTEKYNAQTLVQALIQTTGMEDDVMLAMNGRHRISKHVFAAFQACPGFYAGSDEIAQWSELEENREKKVVVLDNGTIEIFQNGTREGPEPDTMSDERSVYEYLKTQLRDPQCVMIYNGGDHWQRVEEVLSHQQIAFALMQAELGTSVEEVCRALGISDATFYSWKMKYGGSA